MKNYLLPVISVCLLVLIILVMPVHNSFQISSAELIEHIGKHDFIITADQLKLLQKANEVVLVDLREREDYDMSHIHGSVNLPANDLSVRTIRKVFNQPVVYVLYSGANMTASQEWMLITQMGIENVLVLGSGIESQPADEIPSYEITPH